MVSLSSSSPLLSGFESWTEGGVFGPLLMACDTIDNIPSGFWSSDLALICCSSFWFAAKSLLYSSSKCFAVEALASRTDSIKQKSQLKPSY